MFGFIHLCRKCVIANNINNVPLILDLSFWATPSWITSSLGTCSKTQWNTRQVSSPICVQLSSTTTSSQRLPSSGTSTNTSKPPHLNSSTSSTSSSRGKRNTMTSSRSTKRFLSPLIFNSDVISVYCFVSSVV